MTLTSAVSERLAVVDADSHLTDVDDLWTKRAPAAYKDEILHVEEVEGERTWVIEGIPLGKAGGGSTIDREGVKHPFQESMLEWDFERSHVAAWDIDARLEVLDDMGIQHQVTVSQRSGAGGSGTGRCEGPRTAPPGRGDLQRLAGRDPGPHEQPAPAHADTARLGHRGVRPRSAADRRDWVSGEST